jgi:hypothetical protein
LSPHELAGEWLARAPEPSAPSALEDPRTRFETAVRSASYEALTAELLKRGLLTPQDDGPPALAFLPPFKVRDVLGRVVGLMLFPVLALASGWGGVSTLHAHHTIGYRLLAVALFVLCPVLIWLGIRAASTGLSVDENGIRVSGLFPGHMVRWSELVDITYFEKHGGEDDHSTGWVYVLVTTGGKRIRPERPQEGYIGWDSKMANLRLVLLAMRDIARTWPSPAVPGAPGTPSDARD